MKILVCGKGGSGKSTIVSLLAKKLQANGYRILIVDSDESNYGLSSQLGLNDPKELMEQLGGKKAVVDRMWATRSAYENDQLFTEKWTIDQIPHECLSNKDNLYLLEIGKVKHFGEGCACPMGGLSRDFLSNLYLQPKEIAIIDTEAGVEHLGRGVERSVDLVLAILDPSYESILLSEKISTLVKESGKSVYFILNKMDKATADEVSSKIDKSLIAGVIPFSAVIQKNGLRGEELDVSAVDLTEITDFVLKKLQGGND